MTNTIRQRWRRVAAGALATGLLAGPGCATDTDDPGNTGGGCTRIRYDVTYSAVGSGDGSFDFVSYDNGLGQQVFVFNPSKTWTTFFRMCDGDTVGMEAVGAAGNGVLTISVTAQPSTGAPVTTSESYTGNGTVTTDTLRIQDQVLP